MVWNYIDILLALLVLLSIVQGWRHGFILGLLDLLRWIGGVLVGLRFYQPVARWLGPRMDWSDGWDQPVAFLLTAATAGVLIHLLGYMLLRRLPKEVHHRRSNRLLGTLPGLVNGLVAAGIAAALLLAIPLPDGPRTAARQSALANRLAASTERLEAALAPIFDEAVERTLNKLMVRPESSERLNLPYTVTDSRPRPELEAQMLGLVNRERVAVGLEPLTPDPQLTEVARRHSADMFARGYFAHFTPEGHSPFVRIREAGIRFRTAGENLALAPTVWIAHKGLMNSPGHRANILRPVFGRVGIGVMDGGVRGLMVTQNFRD